MANWGGIIGSALAGGIAGAGQGLAYVGQQQMKQDEEQKRMSWQEARDIRLKELDLKNSEALRQSDYETRGGKQEQEARLASSGASTEASLASARVSNANADAAPALKEAQIKNYESEAEYRKGMLLNNADKIQAMLTNGELRAQVERMKKDSDIPVQQKEAVKSYFNSLENIAKDSMLEPEARTKAIDALTAEYGKRIPPQARVRDDGKIEVRDFLGVTRTFGSKEEAAKALGMTSGKSDKKPDDKQEPAPKGSTGSHPDPFAREPMQKSNNTRQKEILDQIADYEDRIKNLPMGESGIARLKLEIADLQRQLKQGGLIGSIQSINAGR